MAEDNTVRRFATVDANGYATGFYVEGGVVPVPEGAVEISEAVWQQWVGNTHDQRWTGTALAFEPPAPPTQTGPRYVPLETLRERLEAKGAGKWDQLATLLDQLPAGKRWKLLTLRAGIEASDPDALALVQAIQEDPAEMLRP